MHGILSNSHISQVFVLLGLKTLHDALEEQLVDSPRRLTLDNEMSVGGCILCISGDHVVDSAFVDVERLDLREEIIAQELSLIHI